MPAIDITTRRPPGPVEQSFVYVLRDPRDRPVFLNLMAQLRPITAALMRLAGANAHSHTLREREDREGWFIETLAFSNEDERARFDDHYSSDRTVAAIQGLIDDLVDASKSDYVVTRGAGKRPAPRV